MIKGIFKRTFTRKLATSIGEYAPAICLVIASYVGCNRVLTIAVFMIGLGMNGAIYSGLSLGKCFDGKLFI